MVIFPLSYLQELQEVSGCDLEEWLIYVWQTECCMGIGGYVEDV